MNRVIFGIARMKDRILEKNLPSSKLEEVSKSLDLSFDEFCRFQELKSAFMGSALTMEEAQTIYEYLGTSPEYFNTQRLEVKAVLTQIFQELLGKTLKNALK